MKFLGIKAMVKLSPNVGQNPLRLRVILNLRNIVVLILPFLFACVACEVDTTVSIDGNNPPTFKFSGSGSLTFFTVKEIAEENRNLPEAQQDREKNKIIWWIWPSAPIDKPMWRLEPITYGKLPPGFYQKVPEEGEPPRLVEGKVYEAGGPAASANGGYIRFIIRDGKTVQVPIP